MTAPRHEPVMRAEVLALLAPAAGERFVDGTFGAGGYAVAILEAADCAVYGIDRDPEAVAEGERLAAGYGGRLRVLAGRFAEMERLLAELGVARVDGVALDLGVSSMQLDEARRGFSFQADGPLDMRMEQAGADAAEFVNGASEAELADVIRVYGEERRARAVARAIVARRAERPFERTADLAATVARAVGKTSGRLHPATRTFQALRIHVNDELAELARGLEAAERLLAPAGRLVVVSFHSLEDREVKRFLRARSGGDGGQSRHLPPAAERPAASFRLPFRGTRKPTEAECRRNPRARSARLRAAVRTDAPALEAAA